MSKEALWGTLALAIVSCVRTPPRSDVGDAPGGDATSAATGLRSPWPATSSPTRLSVHAESEILEVRPLRGAADQEANAEPSSDNRYALDVNEYEHTFVVWEGATHEVLAKGSGWYARWHSPTDVLLVDTSSRLAKFHVRAPTHIVNGRKLCGPVMPCNDGEPPPRPIWVSQDLERAIVLRHGREQYILRHNDIVPVAQEIRNASEGAMLAFGVSNNGTACALLGAEPDRDGNPGRQARLWCARPPWSQWLHLRDFALPRPLNVSSDDAVVSFFAEEEVLLSWAERPREFEGPRIRHCLVTLETGAARCSPDLRPHWSLLGDGRWLIEYRTPDHGGEHLIDLLQGRSWAIKKVGNAIWHSPRRDRRASQTLLLRRLDKADVRWGELHLPHDR